MEPRVHHVLTEPGTQGARRVADDPLAGLPHADSDHHHLVDDAMVLPDLQVERIQPPWTARAGR